MTKLEFEKQVARLTSTFSNKYPGERVLSLWNQVKDFDSSWFTRIINQAITSFKDPSWHEELAKKREVTAEDRKSQYRKEHQALNSIYTTEDVKEHFRVLRGLINKTISAEDGRKYTQILKDANQGAAPSLCIHCEDSGLVFGKSGAWEGVVLKCFCSKGSARPEDYTQAKDPKTIYRPYRDVSNNE